MSLICCPWSIFPAGHWTLGHSQFTRQWFFLLLHSILRSLAWIADLSSLFCKFSAQLKVGLAKVLTIMRIARYIYPQCMSKVSPAEFFSSDLLKDFDLVAFCCRVVTSQEFIVKCSWSPRNGQKFQRKMMKLKRNFPSRLWWFWSMVVS